MLSLALLAALINPGRPSFPIARRDSLHAEPVILEVVVGTTASATMYALRSGDAALLPLEQVLALVGLPPAGDTDRFEPTDSLAARLGVSINVDWDELTVTISDDGMLPVSQRAAREQRRAQFERSRFPRAIPADVATLRRHVLPHTVTIDYDVDLASDRNQLQPVLRFGLGATLLGGGLDIDLARAATFRQAAVTWWRSWPTYSALRELRAGALNIENVGAGIGFSVSSESPNHRAAVESIVLSGRAPSGSQIEVYRDDVFIYANIVDSSAEYRIRIPALTGINNLKVVTFGPRGEESSASRHISIDESMIRRGTGTYNLSAARCANGNCEYAAQLNMRYAPFDRVTFGGGATALRVAGKRVVDITSVLAIQLRDDLNGVIQSGSRGLHAKMQYGPDSSLQLSASYRSIAARPALDHQVPATATTSLAVVWRPSGLGPLTGNIDDAATVGRRRTRFRIGSFLSVGSTYIQPFLTFTPGSREGVPRRTFGGYADVAIPVPVSGSRLHLASNDQFSGESSLEIAFPIARMTRIVAGATFVPGTRAPRMTVAMQMLNSALRYDARTTVAGAGRVTTHRISGSATLTAGSGSAVPKLALSSEPSRGRSEIIGTVFIDDNSNGVKDEGEPALPGVAVAVGPSIVETDAAGQYHVFDVVPFVPIVINVDALTLPDTAVHVRAVRITPLPNEVLRVEIPVPATASQSTSRSVANLDRIAQHAESGDSSSVHCDYFESRAAYTNPVTNPWQPTETREDVTAERGPVAFRDLEVILRARIDK